ncbi:MAG: acetylxylan esterase [Candidatus Brocadiia bacterium]
MHELTWGLAFVVALAAARAAGGGKDPLRVLPPAEGHDLVRQYLLAECQKHFDARRKAVREITTPEQFRARYERLRERWLEALGDFPEKTPLEARVVGTLDREGYRIEKVLYQSRPDHHVTANFYVPTKGKPPFPALLVPSGHSRNAKAAHYNQACCILAATHGIAALAYDPFGQGERCQLLDDDGKPIVWGTTEHTLADIGARLGGRGAANYRIWDGIRSIDYLGSRPEVDADRIGCTGCSGGGTMTAYLMATDERIVAAAPSCYITSLERLFATIGPQDGEQNITGQVARGIEHADYVALHAPRPTLLLTATDDFFDIAGSWDTYRQATRLYTILGHAERLDILESPGGHGYPPVQRSAMLRWMRRWLQGIDDAPTEGKLDFESDADLQVTDSGQVVRDLGGVTVWDLNLRRARELAPEREAFWRDNPRATCLAEVERLAGIRPVRKRPSVASPGPVSREDIRIEKLLIERPDEVPVPALLFVPAAAEGRLPGVLYVDGRGKAHDAGPGGPVEKLAREGRVVLSIDARGFGETEPVKPRRYWHAEFSIAYLAIHLDRPLLGQRTEDALAALEVLAQRPEVDPERLSIVGIERGGPVALHAAALDQRLREVTVQQAIESWMDVVATPQCEGQLGQVVPGALARYDLPDLLRAIAPRQVHIRKPVDARGKPKK